MVLRRHHGRSCDLNHNFAVWQGYGLFASNGDVVWKFMVSIRAGKCPATDRVSDRAVLDWSCRLRHVILRVRLLMNAEIEALLRRHSR